MVLGIAGVWGVACAKFTVLFGHREIIAKAKPLVCIGDVVPPTIVAHPPRNLTTADAKAAPVDLVGLVRRFGPRGEPYEVLAVQSRDEVKIRVIPTGEETTYPIRDFLTDPED
jgi:hypothetical protein